MNDRRGLKVHIIGFSSSNNSLTRALSHGLAAQEIADAEIHAFLTGALWVGASKYPFDVQVFGKKEIQGLARRIAREARERPVVVWLCKGRWPLDRIAAALEGSSAMVIADFSDDERALSDAVRDHGLLGKILLLPLIKHSPAGTTRSQRAVLERADAVTAVSQHLAGVLAQQYGAPRCPTRLIPHTRLDFPGGPTGTRATADRIRAGFLGTVRQHKRLDRLIDLTRRDRRIHGVVYRQHGVTIPGDVADRWTLIDPDTPLHEAYAMIDVLVIPSEEDVAITASQLPAKRVDAAVAGCAVLATPTPAISEYARDAILAVHDWADQSELSGLLEPGRIRESGQRMRALYEDRFSPRRTSAQLAALLSELGIAVPR
ncbi:glycosyltransferase family 4 protein [Hoyosella sp. G463]|uniref:Glycosyltransferase family 4 protein n=1 Tax=Lolliginicoccus lacisalsi TaxID=2742202 RepID=A0A927JDH8_9ACTN|nr:glycosyltransferase family 4 protein [Lolliginicoccus lacisalsi]MBD8507160.1 glycosyltransferase family 4 protein [Lolliginicoccus lacisalsi]